MTLPIDDLVFHSSLFALIRIFVWGFLGPHMRLVDMWKKSPDRNLPRLFAEQIFEARRRQEDASALKIFRALCFGDYSSRVPGSVWTPHVDRPLPESDAVRIAESEFPTIDIGSRYIPGQQLYGSMIPRPKKKWSENQEVSKREKDRIGSILLDPAAVSPVKKARFAFDDDEDGLRDEGVEIRASIWASIRGSIRGQYQ